MLFLSKFILFNLFLIYYIHCGGKSEDIQRGVIERRFIQRIRANEYPLFLVPKSLQMYHGLDIPKENGPIQSQETTGETKRETAHVESKTDRHNIEPSSSESVVETKSETPDDKSNTNKHDTEPSSSKSVKKRDEEAYDGGQKLVNVLVKMDKNCLKCPKCGSILPPNEIFIGRPAKLKDYSSKKIMVVLRLIQKFIDKYIKSLNPEIPLEFKYFMQYGLEDFFLIFYFDYYQDDTIIFGQIKTILTEFIKTINSEHQKYASYGQNKSLHFIYARFQRKSTQLWRGSIQRSSNFIASGDDNVGWSIFLTLKEKLNGLRNDFLINFDSLGATEFDRIFQEMTVIINRGNPFEIRLFKVNANLLHNHFSYFRFCDIVLREIYPCVYQRRTLLLTWILNVEFLQGMKETLIEMLNFYLYLLELKDPLMLISRINELDEKYRNNECVVLIIRNAEVFKRNRHLIRFKG